MPAPSLIVPLSISSPTREGLSREILKLQARLGAKIGIVNIVQDITTKEWVCWYIEPTGVGLGAV